MRAKTSGNVAIVLPQLSVRTCARVRSCLVVPHNRFVILGDYDVEFQCADPEFERIAECLQRFPGVGGRQSWVATSRLAELARFDGLVAGRRDLLKTLLLPMQARKMTGHSEVAVH